MRLKPLSSIDLGGRIRQCLEGVERIQALFDAPAENAPGIVVDDCVQIYTRAIDEAKNAGMDVPKLVGARGSNPDLWLRWVDAESRS
jgi:hypothetical protein